MMLSNHFKHSLKVLGGVILVLLGSYFWLKHHIIKAYEASHPVITLPKNVKERVSFNEKTHIVTVITSKGTIRQYARNPQVDITTFDTVLINRHLTGFETQWFMGIGYADCTRVFLGMNFFHLGRFDLNGSIAGVPDDTKVFLKSYAGIGYNFYSNTSINVAINPINVILRDRPDIAGFVSIKF